MKSELYALTPIFCMGARLGLGYLQRWRPKLSDGSPSPLLYLNAKTSSSTADTKMVTPCLHLGPSSMCDGEPGGREAAPVADGG
jgi:hypothetical protein